MADKQEAVAKVADPITQEDLDRAAFSGPALSANRFSISVGPNGVRVAALEQASLESKPEYRTAFITSPQQAIQLYKLLARMLAGIEAQINAREAEMATTDGPEEPNNG